MKAIAAARTLAPEGITQAQAAQMVLPRTPIVVAEDGIATFALPPGEFLRFSCVKAVTDRAAYYSRTEEIPGEEIVARSTLGKLNDLRSMQCKAETDSVLGESSRGWE